MYFSMNFSDRLSAEFPLSAPLPPLSFSQQKTIARNGARPMNKSVNKLTIEDNFTYNIISNSGRISIVYAKIVDFFCKQLQFYHFLTMFSFLFILFRKILLPPAELRPVNSFILATTFVSF